MGEDTGIDLVHVPAHVGIIMDGNGRWAKNRGKARTFGHKEGLKAAKRVVKTASDIGIKILSLYAFSTENWKRAESEVSYLMFLMNNHLKKEFNFYRRNRIRVVHSGNIRDLSPDIAETIRQITADTELFTGLTVNLAINYGGRAEIIQAVTRWLKAESEITQGLKEIHLTEEELRSYLDHPEIPDPDLIIRTSGEMRLSNFLLWGSAYSELFFSHKLWPDWDGEDLLEAIRCYQNRVRKFGGT
ncbi:MAG TPA: polyprenyl diphosphate synthase [Spirochaetia bacterium]|nr:polyprenyl diphosphate synthase [Spirochaetia bacterium]